MTTAEETPVEETPPEVPPAEEEEEAPAEEENGDTVAADATVKLAELQESLNGERADEEQALEQGETIADALADRVPLYGSPYNQDTLAYENARAGEATGQGVVKTTQEALWQISRDEEAKAQGVESITNTTQHALRVVSRQEEAVAEKLEEAAHGPLDTPTIGQRSFAMQAPAVQGGDPAEREEPAEPSEAEEAALAAREA